MSDSPPFFLRSVEEIETLPPLSWLIEDIIPLGSLAVLYGSPNVGKSFLSLAYAMAIGAGRHWFGREVDEGWVIYNAAEGAHGLSRRVHAWKKQSDFEGQPRLDFITEAVQPLDARHVQHLLTLIDHAKTKPRLIVFDTLARSLVGAEENSARDVGAFVAAVDKIRQTTGAAVLLVHHSGKDTSKEARGSTALLGAADTVLRLAKAPNGLALECMKQKDAAPFGTIGLRLEQVYLDRGETSCVLREQIIEIVPRSGLTPAERKALHALGQLGEAGATSTEWMLATKLPEQTFQRVRRHLAKSGLVHHSGSGKGSSYTITMAGWDAITTK